jgi:benzoate membrane transport protein
VTDQSLPSGAPVARGSFAQPVTAGLLAALVGFSSTFTVILAGYAAVGASPAQAASGLLVICLMQGVLGAGFSLVTRLPISIVWSTPGAALLLATGAQPGGYPTALGATVVAGALIVVAGLWPPFRRLVEAIPTSLANAMLSGVLFEICIAPVHAVHQSPWLALPVIVAWALALRFARRYAVLIAVAVTAVIVTVATHLPPGTMASAWPILVPTMPVFRLDAIGSLALPLFVVTMASQNIPGLAVLRANGFRPDLRAALVGTGLGGMVNAFGSGGLINLAAITAALCAGPEADPDPARRWIASLTAGLAYIMLGLGAAAVAAFILASPPSLIQAVAGLALMGAFANALSTALAAEKDRIAVAVTFATVASGVSFLGVGAAFWGLLAGGLLLAVERRRRPA